MVSQNLMENAVDHRTAFVQRTKFQVTAEADDLEWRSNRSDIPTRVPSRIFVTGGQINPPLAVEVTKQTCESELERDFGCASSDRDAAAGLILQLGHKGSLPFSVSDLFCRSRSWRWVDRRSSSAVPNRSR